MSISEFFNRKARAMAAAAALALGAAGGYVGMEAGNSYNQPQASDFTLAAVPENVTERQFISGHIPGVKEDAAQRAMRQEFSRRIDRTAGLADPAAREDSAVRLVTALRTGDRISEKDYQSLVDEYNRRVGLDVTARTGNYRDGAAFNQECQVGAAFGSFFDDEEMTPEELSADVGACMQQAEAARDKAALGGAAGGAALGGLLGLPLWLRRRKGPKVFKNRKP
jgi:hypothetical protein